MTPWEVAISIIVAANGGAISALGVVVGLHLRDVARVRREQGKR